MLELKKKCNLTLRYSSSAFVSFSLMMRSLSLAMSNDWTALVTAPSSQERPPHISQPAPPQRASHGSPFLPHTWWFNSKIRSCLRMEFEYHSHARSTLAFPRSKFQVSRLDSAVTFRCPFYFRQIIRQLCQRDLQSFWSFALRRQWSI